MEFLELALNKYNFSEFVTIAIITLLAVSIKIVLQDNRSTNKQTIHENSETNKRLLSVNHEIHKNSSDAINALAKVFQEFSLCHAFNHKEVIGNLSRNHKEVIENFDDIKKKIDELHCK